jgi:tight adherence protein C
MAARTSLPRVAHVVDGVAVAVERGTSLGDVLRARRRTVASRPAAGCSKPAARRKIAMMTPVNLRF